MSDPICIHYPLITSKMCDTAGSKEKAVEILKHVRHNLYEEITTLDNQIEELEA